MKKNENYDIIVGRLLSLSLRNFQLSSGTRRTDICALLMARAGRVDEAWSLVKQVYRVRERENLAWQIAREFRFFLGAEIKDVHLAPILALLDHGDGHLDLARILAKTAGKKYRWRYYLAVYKKTSDVQDLRNAIGASRLVRMFSESDLLKMLIEISEVAQGQEDSLERVKRYYQKEVDCFSDSDDEELRLRYWELLSTFEANSELRNRARAKAKRLRVRIKKREELELLQLEQQKKSFDGRLRSFLSTGEEDYLQTLVNMIFSASDINEQAKRTLAVLHAIDQRSEE
jgi:hypothetical protein